MRRRILGLTSSNRRHEHTTISLLNDSAVTFCLGLHWLCIDLPHLDALDTKLFKGLVDGFLLCFYHHPLGVQHEHIHGKPLCRHPERVAVGNHWIGSLHYLSREVITANDKLAP